MPRPTSKPSNPREPNWFALPVAQIRERLAAALARRTEWIATGALGPETTAYRLVQGNREGLPGLLVDALGEGVILAQCTSAPPDPALKALLEELQPGVAVYLKLLSQGEKTAPQLLAGPPVGEPFTVRENGVFYRIDLAAGYSQGLFLDQRENRARVRELSGGLRVLNTFAYTCAFSVSAALGGASEVLSLDLAKPALEWGKANFTLNGLDPALPEHDFLAGDVFHWLERFVKKGRQFDLVILDPPTFSRTKEGRVFQVERDYGALVELAARLLPPPDRGSGCLLCCTNQRSLPPEAFATTIRQGLLAANRPDLARTLQAPPLPPDFLGDDGMKNVWVGG